MYCDPSHRILLPNWTFEGSHLGCNDKKMGFLLQLIAGVLEERLTSIERKACRVVQEAGYAATIWRLLHHKL